MTKKKSQKIDGQSIDKVNRVEVIDEKGRNYVNWNDENIVEIQLQDDNRTLKIFIRQKNGKQ